ncbi:MAG: T9SS type A sorting domain-containing protein [Candidatus Eisenbacteria bacterium]|nr:T9SS type A sorting domain-containing protein [Candidatus Eisenbacteria bacterium]
MPRLRLPCAVWLFVLVLTATQGASFVAAEDGDMPPRSDYLLQTSVMGAGGAPGASENFLGNGTLGQSTPPSVSASPDHTLYAGFWKRIMWLLTDVEPPELESYVTRLHQNIPNPFEDATTIRYSVAHESPVEIAVYDISGRCVRTLVKGTAAPGAYSIVWDGRNDSGIPATSGVYFYRFSVGSYTSVKRMLVLN